MPRRRKEQYYRTVKIPVRIIKTEKQTCFGFNVFKPVRSAFASAAILLLILSQTNILVAYEAHIISVTAAIEDGIANYLVINKVYYDVDEEHGRESKNEWIELYNPTDQEINLKNWQICNNYECRVIHPNNIIIPAFGYALLSHDNSTWVHYWDVPNEVVTVNIGAAPEPGWLGNDADMLILKDPDGNIVDQMNWGMPDVSWPNYNSNIWDPGADGVAEGNMLGRSPNGFDTDQPSDWQEFAIPDVTVIVPNGFEVWWVGHTYNLEWTAFSSVGDSSDLSIDIWYSADSGATWANIITGTENDGVYEWRVSLFLDGLYTPSDQARIKVVATDITTNFMITNWDMSDNDFCPPIDFDLLTPEELAMYEAMFGSLTVDDEASAEEEIPDESGSEEPIDDEASAEEEIPDESGIEEPSEPLEEPSEPSDEAPAEEVPDESGTDEPIDDEAITDEEEIPLSGTEPVEEPLEEPIEPVEEPLEEPVEEVPDESGTEEIPDESGIIEPEATAPEPITPEDQTPSE